MLTDGGEESGLFGAKAFVNDNKDWLKTSLKALLEVDQFGGSESMLYMQGTRWLELMWLAQAEAMGYRLTACFDPEVLSQPSLGDAEPFFKLGIPAASLGGYPVDRYYHTEADTPDKVSANEVKAVADVVAAVVSKLASA